MTSLQISCVKINKHKKHVLSMTKVVLIFMGTLGLTVAQHDPDRRTVYPQNHGFEHMIDVLLMIKDLQCPLILFCLTLWFLFGHSLALL